MEMPDWVRREEVIREIELYCARHPDRMSGNKDFLPWLLAEIRDLPGIEIVFCANCKRWDHQDHDLPNRGWCKLLGEATWGHFYCGQGKRREEHAGDD